MDNKPAEIVWSVKKKSSGKIYQKLPFATLKAWILEARIDPDDLVTNAVLQKWTDAGDIDELAPFFAPESLGSDVVSGGEIAFPWQTSGKGSDDVELDLTPMIDITFLLLTFFLATATFAIHQVKNVDIPKATHVQEHKQEKLAITIDKDRRIYIGRKEVTLQSLKNTVKDEVAKTQQQDMVLAADHSIDYGFIVAVLDEINGAGLKSIKLKLEKKK